MTTMTPKRKAGKKPLRIRPEFLPKSAIYGTFAEREYVMIPVEDFAEWYEDIEDNAIIEYSHDDPAPAIPMDEMMRRVKRKRKGSKS